MNSNKRFIFQRQDVIPFLQSVKPESIDLVLTDPPYNISKENNFNTMKTSNRTGIDFGEWDKGFNQTEWIKHLYKIVSKNGSVIIFNTWINMGDISKALEKNGFIVKDLIQWVKTNPMPRNMNRRYLSNTEYILWVVKKGAKWTFNLKTDEKYALPEYKTPLTTIKSRFHPTQKNLELLKMLINRHSNKDDLVLDCFFGSGSTAIACLETERRFIGCEIDKTYFEKAIEWYKKEKDKK